MTQAKKYTAIIAAVLSTFTLLAVLATSPYSPIAQAQTQKEQGEALKRQGEAQKDLENRFNEHQIRADIYRLGLELEIAITKKESGIEGQDALIKVLTRQRNELLNQLETN